MAGKRKSYKRRNKKGKASTARQTPEQKILEYMLGLKDEVLKREVMPWDSGRMGHLPYNPFTRHKYGGTYNAVMLQMMSFVYGWQDPRFVTRGKAKELNADFRGQKMTHLWYPVPRKEVNEDTGEEEVVGIYYRSFFVFNVEQFANLSELDIPPLEVSTWGDTPIAERIEAVREHMLDNFKLQPLIREDALIRAPYYRPQTHEVVLPPTSQYAKPERFTQSMIHELTHATGAPSELGRFRRDEYGSPCSPEKGDYAYEEMVTQYATAYLLTQYGFAHERKTSAAYILSWYKSIEDRPELLGQSIREAMAVVRYVNNGNPLPNYTELDDEVELAAAA